MKLKQTFFTLTLWWAIAGMSVWIGGTVFMMTVINPQWDTNPPFTVRAFFTHTLFNRYRYYFFGIPFIAVRSLIPVSLALILGRCSTACRKYLLAALTCTLVTFMINLIFTGPLNEALMQDSGGDNSAEAIKEMTTLWLWADRTLFALNLLGFYFLLKAFRSTDKVPE